MSDFVCNMCGRPGKPSGYYVSWCVRCEHKYGHFDDYEESTYEPIIRRNSYDYHHEHR